jgi:hypothetical protein
MVELDVFVCVACVWHVCGMTAVAAVWHDCHVCYDCHAAYVL